MTTLTESIHDHRALETRVQQLLAFYRKKFLIPPRWRIDVAVCCPDYWEQREGVLPPSGSMSWEYLANAQYRMRICCTGYEDKLEWTIAHELLEAIMAPYAEFAEGLLVEQRRKSHIQLLNERHQEIRDEVIEWMLAIMLPEKRPDIHPQF